MTRIGFITGIKKESEILRKCTNYPHNDIVCAGADSKRAYYQASKLVTNGCSLLISFGIAGGLDPALKAGDLVLASSLVDEKHNIFNLDQREQKKLITHLSTTFNISNNKIFGSTNIISSTKEKQRLFISHTATAVDMESLGVAQAANEKKCPFLIIRAIADTADQHLPTASLRSIDKNGNIKIGTILLDLALNPKDLTGLIKLAFNSRKALTSLSRVAVLGFGL